MKLIPVTNKIYSRSDGGATTGGGRPARPNLGSVN